MLKNMDKNKDNSPSPFDCQKSQSPDSGGLRRGLVRGLREPAWPSSLETLPVLSYASWPPGPVLGSPHSSKGLSPRGSLASR